MGYEAGPVTQRSLDPNPVLREYPHVSEMLAQIALWPVGASAAPAELVASAGSAIRAGLAGPDLPTGAGALGAPGAPV